MVPKDGNRWSKGNLITDLQKIQTTHTVIYLFKWGTDKGLNISRDPVNGNGTRKKKKVTFLVYSYIPPKGRSSLSDPRRDPPLLFPIENVSLYKEDGTNWNYPSVRSHPSDDNISPPGGRWDQTRERRLSVPITI